MELLELLAKQKNCTYISDLRFLPKSDRHFPQLKEVDITAYSDREWKDVALYVLNRRCRSGEQARKHLLVKRYLLKERLMEDWLNEHGDEMW